MNTAEQRFWPKVDKGESCWEWRANRSAKGHGRFWDGTRLAHAHRFAYELLVGPIPTGLTLDHLCRNPPCVNPAHLEPVTRAENTHREHLARNRTHCRNGHLLDEANTYRPPNRRGERVCRTCDRARALHYSRAKRRRPAQEQGAETDFDPQNVAVSATPLDWDY